MLETIKISHWHGQGKTLSFNKDFVTKTILDLVEKTLSVVKPIQALKNNHPIVSKINKFIEKQATQLLLS